MCYGYDGERPLERSLARRGTPSRRSLLRGGLAAAAAGGAALALGGTATAAASPAGHRPPWGRPLVPRDRISIQLYSLRDAFGDGSGYDAMLRKVARIGYPRVEQALGFFGRTAAELREFYDHLGIAATSSHEDVSDSREALEKKVEDAATLGQSYLVVPYLDSDDADDWRRWAQQMNEEAELARSAGIRYGYHNHAHEFTADLGRGRTPWDVLTSELDPSLVHLEIDLFWAVTGAVESGDGVDDPERFTLDVIRRAPQRTLQYHVKDRTADGEMVDPGRGDIDFPRIFAHRAVEEYIVEHDEPENPTRTARTGYAYLHALGRHR